MNGRKLSKPLERAIRRGDVTVVGVGQGRQTVQSAWTKQAEAERLVSAGSSRTRLIAHTVDTDGERGVIIAPAIGRQRAADLGAHFGQRSVLDGKREVRSSDGAILTEFGTSTVSGSRLKGFWTAVPSRGLYFTYHVRSHTRGGRPVRGYATRRRQE